MENKIKRFLSLALALFMVLSMMPQITLGASAEETGTTVYFEPGTWTSDNARFAVYYWNDNGSAWVDMAASTAHSGYYVAVIPAGYTNLIICRMSPNTTNDWSNKWNQSADLTIQGNCYSWNHGNEWNSPAGEWTLMHTPGAAATCYTAQTCTVCGAELNPATGSHTYDTDGKCTTDGCTAECSHSYGEWIDGQKTCSVCQNVVSCEHSYTDGACTVCGAEDPNYEPTPTYVAQIGETKYETLAAALNAAQNGETVTLIWNEGDPAISMAGEVTGNKTVTITGTALVDWTKGWLFVGRGSNTGDGKLIFNNANLTSNANSSGDHGIHISGHEKGSATKNNGTVEMINSKIELDFLINKGTLTVDNTNLTVRYGFGIAGRPASETEDGKDATATIDIKNGSIVVVENENGMGMGYEGNGILNLTDSTFQCNSVCNVANEEGSSFNVSGTSTLIIKTVNGQSLNLLDGAIIKDSKIGGSITVMGDLSIVNGLELTGAIFLNNEDAVLNVNSGAKVNASSISGNGTINVSGEVTATAVTGDCTINLAAVNATLTAAEGLNVGTTLEDYNVTYAEGAYILTAKPYVAQVGETKYEKFAEALDAVQDGGTITLLEGATGSELSTEIEYTKDISFTITGKAPEYALPTVTFQNATVTIKGAEILIPELDARQNATINVVDSIVHDAGGNSIVKSYYNGAINISGNSVVYTMQVTTMGYITISDTAELHATWQTNVYGNGMIIVEEGATFKTAALHLTGQDYSSRDNTDADRVGKPATIVVDGANFIVGKVQSNNGADYSYNSSKGINIGTIEGKAAVLDIKNGANVNIYMANGETANIGADGTVNVDGSTFNVACRGEGDVTLANNGTINVSGTVAATAVTGDGTITLTAVNATLTAAEGLNVTTTVADYNVTYEGGTYKLVAKVYVAQIGETKYEKFAEALDAVQDGGTITLLEGATGDESSTELDFTKDIEFTITGKAPNYALPVITFQNATVTIKDAEILIPELDARQNATINVVDSIVHDAGGNSIVKSYYNGAINISGNSVVYTMQVTTMGYITISDTAELHATWQTNVYGNGMIIVEEGATFKTAALHLTGQDYSSRDNTDADRVGKPATIVVDGANFIVGKVQSNNGADYSYNSSKGINIGTVEGKAAVLDIKNGATVEIYMANGETANIGADGTVNVDGSTFNVACRGEGDVTLANNGTINVSDESTLNVQKLTENRIVVANGATLTDSKIGGSITVMGDLSIVNGLELTGDIFLNNEDAVLNVNSGAKVNASSISGTGKIVIDDSEIAAAEAGTSVQIIVGDASAITADQITLVNGIGVDVTINEEGVTLTRSNTVAAIGNVAYKTVSAAIAAANANDTVVLLCDATDDMVIINKAVTLDLNGHNLTANYVAAFSGSHVVDRNPEKGLLIVDQNAIMLPTNNAQMPVWNESNGYIFAGMKMSYEEMAEAEGFVFKSMFKPSFGKLGAEKLSIAKTYFVDEHGVSDNGLQIIIRLSWENGSGNKVSQDFLFNDALAKEVYTANNVVFTLGVTSLASDADVTAQVVVVSTTGAEYVSAGKVYSAN